MNIRTAGLMDIDKILILEDQIFEIHLQARPDWIGKNPKNYEYKKAVIEGNNGKIFIAEEDNNIIGLCIINIREINNHHMFHDMTNIEIENICIDEKYKKKGIGKKLFEEVKRFAKENNAKNIELSVWEFNKDAIKFYEKMGMKIRTIRMEYKI
jgi:ribosomal protein S18 acetylase RimI-like enzyme